MTSRNIPKAETIYRKKITALANDLIERFDQFPTALAVEQYINCQTAKEAEKVLEDMRTILVPYGYKVYVKEKSQYKYYIQISCL